MPHQPPPPSCSARTACVYTAGNGLPVCSPGVSVALQSRTEAAKDAASFRLSQRPRGPVAFYSDADGYELDCAVKVRPVDPRDMPW